LYKAISDFEKETGLKVTKIKLRRPVDDGKERAVAKVELP
jgi:hypothetical protein